jgi:hypothetical protein
VSCIILLMNFTQQWQIRSVYAKRKGNNHNSKMQASVVTVENQSTSWKKQLPRYVRSQLVVSFTVVQPTTENMVLTLLIPKLCVLTFPIKFLVLYFLVPQNFKSCHTKNSGNPILPCSIHMQSIPCIAILLFTHLHNLNMIKHFCYSFNFLLKS